MLLVSTGLGKRSRIVLSDEKTSVYEVKKETSTHQQRKNGQIDLIVRSRFSTDENAQNLTKSAVQLGGHL